MPRFSDTGVSLLLAIALVAGPATGAVANENSPSQAQDNKKGKDQQNSQTPSDDVPSDDVPSDDVPSDDVPSDDVPSDDVPSDDRRSDDVPSDDITSDTPPADTVENGSSGGSAANKDPPAADRDPRWKDFLCLRTIFGPSDSLGELLNRSSSSCAETENNDSQPSSLIENFSGNSLVELKASEPTILPTGAGWSSGSDGWTIQVSGSEQTIVRAFQDLVLGAPQSEPCARIDMRVTGLAHTPAQGAPVMRESHSTSVVVCSSATAFDQTPTVLSSRLISWDPFVGESLTSSSIGVAYSLRTTTPDVCATDESLVSSVAAGTCDISVVVDGVDVALYTLKVVEDPRWKDFLCSLTIFGPSDSLGELLNRSSSSCAENNDSPPLSLIENFSDNSLVELKASEPTILPSGAGWSSGSDGWTIQVSGSEQTIAQAFQDLVLGAPQSEPCALIDMRVTGLEPTPPIMRESHSTSVVVCSSATAFGQARTVLSSRLISSEPFVPRWEGESLTSSSIGVAYSLRTTTPGVCAMDGLLVSSVAAGTCDISVVVDGVDVARYTLEVVSGFGSMLDSETVERMMPDFLAPVTEPELDMSMSDDVWQDLVTSLLPAGSNPDDFSMASSVRQVGNTFTAQVSLDGLGHSFPLTPVSVSFGVDGVDSFTETGRLSVSPARGLTIQPSNFMAGQLVTAMMFSERKDLGSFDPSTEATLDIPAGLSPGEHTLRLVGMSVEGVLLSISVPVFIENPVLTGDAESPAGISDPPTSAPAAADQQYQTVQARVSRPDNDGSYPSENPVCVVTTDRPTTAREGSATGCPTYVNADDKPSMTPMFTLRSPAAMMMLAATLLGGLGIGWWFLGSRRERESYEIFAALHKPIR